MISKPEAQNIQAKLAVSSEGVIQMSYKDSGTESEYFAVQEQISAIAKPMIEIAEKRKIKNLRIFAVGGIVEGTRELRDADIYFVFDSISNTPDQAMESEHEYIISEYDRAVNEAANQQMGQGISFTIGYVDSEYDKNLRGLPDYYDIGFNTTESLIANLKNVENCGTIAWLQKTALVAQELSKSAYTSWYDENRAFMDHDKYADENVISLILLLSKLVDDKHPQNITDFVSKLIKPKLFRQKYEHTTVGEDFIFNDIDNLDNKQINERITTWLTNKLEEKGFETQKDNIDKMIADIKTNRFDEDTMVAFAEFSKALVKKSAWEATFPDWKKILYPIMSALKSQTLWQTMEESAVQIYGEPLIIDGKQYGIRDESFLKDKLK